MTSQENAEGRLLTCAEVALRVRESPGTVADWCRTGKLPATRPGRGWRIRPEDVDALLVKHSNQPAEGVA